MGTTGRMASGDRRWRSAVAATIVVLTVAGTLVGSDDWYPFAPMRQYAYAVDPDGRVSTHVVEGVGVDGAPVPITYGDLDMRPAELEGVLRDVRTRTVRLADVLDTLRRRRPDAPRLIGIRYLRRVQQLVDGRPGEVSVVELGRYDEVTR